MGNAIKEEVTITYENGVETGRTEKKYDSFGRLEQETVKKGSQTVLITKYVYNDTFWGTMFHNGTISIPV